MRGWKVIASFMLRRRIPILIVVALATGFMFLNRSSERSHDFGKIIPADDPDFIEYQEFRKEFGDDGNVLVIGFEGDIFSRKVFNGLIQISEDVLDVDGVTNVVSIANAVNINANYATESFELLPLVTGPIQSDAEMDSLGKVIKDLRFYQGLLFNQDATSTLLIVTIDSKRLDSSEKARIVHDITDATEAISKDFGIEPRYSGLPYIRAYITDFIPREMYLFLGIAVAVMALVLFFTFRSVTAVFFPMIVIGIVIIWAMGLMGLLEYKITVLTAILPSLIAVIGVPNTIYLLTKYHFEYKRTGNQGLALVNVIQKIGVVTVMTNATTATGFGVLAFTDIQMLKEFGILAGLSVVVTFFISLVLIPIIFSFLPPPSAKHVRHIDRRSLMGAIRFLDKAVTRHRWVVYGVTMGLTGFAVYGMTLLEPRALMVDDIPRDDRVISDLEFFEDRFGGVMPFEIVVNTHRKQGIFKRGTLNRLDKFQAKLDRFPELSRSLSIADLIKFSRQSFMSGVGSEYQIPSSEEFLAIQSFINNSKLDSAFSRTVIYDTTFSKARITSNVKDVGAAKMSVLMDSVQMDLEDIFVRNTKSGRLKEGESYRLYGTTDSFRIQYAGVEYMDGEAFDVQDTTSTYEILSGEGKIDFADRYTVTGTTKIFIKSNSFLIANLVQSLIIAFCVIAVLMALLFRSVRMVFVALVPNFLPLLLTAGIMGYADIPLKPSTALIFSVAFGIAVDDTIHYLARYRLARKTGSPVIEAVTNSFKDTGVSMIYTSIILFFGFVIFSFSSYGGTEALGQLTSLTLLIALFTNLLLLPSLLISINRDDQKVPETGWIDYDEEREEVERIKELFQGKDG